MTQQPTDPAATERRLLAEADYVYDFENWETTYDDLGTLADEANLACHRKGAIGVIGRLKALPHAYAVNLPTAFDDEGHADEWNVVVFETREAAAAAYAATICAVSRHSPDAPTAERP